MHLAGLRKTTDICGTIFGVSIDIQTAQVPKTNQKPCSLSQLARPKVETNIDVKYLGLK
jgi:hypothetical protein